MKFRFIANAGQLWHQIWTVRLAILTTAYTAAAGAWMVLPDDWKPDLSHTSKIILASIGVLLPAVTGVARVIKQPNLPTLPGAPKC